MEFVKGWVLKYPNGEYVAIDNSSGAYSSGGYPYPTASFRTATIFWSREEADKVASYRDGFTKHAFHIIWEFPSKK